MGLDKGVILPAVEEEFGQGPAEQPIRRQPEATKQHTLDERDPKMVVGGPDGRREIGEDLSTSGDGLWLGLRTRPPATRSGWRAGRIRFSHGQLGEYFILSRFRPTGRWMRANRCPRASAPSSPRVSLSGCALGGRVLK